MKIGDKILFFWNNYFWWRISLRYTWVSSSPSFPGNRCSRSCRTLPNLPRPMPNHTHRSTTEKLILDMWLWKNIIQNSITLFPHFGCQIRGAPSCHKFVILFPFNNWYRNKVGVHTSPYIVWCLSCEQYSHSLDPVPVLQMWYIFIFLLLFELSDVIYWNWNETCTNSTLRHMYHMGGFPNRPPHILSRSLNISIVKGKKNQAGVASFLLTIIKISHH